MTTPALNLATTAATPLSHRAMTVALHLSAWRGQRVDMKVTAEVLTERNADKDAGRFQKALVPPKSLEGVTKAHSAARARHYALTLPWGDQDGARILASPAFFDYSNAMREERSKCEAAYRAFALMYPSLRAAAPLALGSMYNSADFPTVDQLEAKFGFTLEVLPVPDKDDFRVSLGSEAEAEVRASIEKVVTQRASDAQLDLWTRVLDTMKHFTTTMTDTDKVFRDTTVTKLADLARIAPKLSLVSDPRLTALCEEILTLVNRTSPETLRTNPLAREASAVAARATLAKITSAMNGAF